MNMVGHDYEGVKQIVLMDVLPIPDDLDHKARNLRTPKVDGTRVGSVEEAIHGCKGDSSLSDFGRKVPVSGQSSVEAPGYEQGFLRGMPMREPA